MSRKDYEAIARAIRDSRPHDFVNTEPHFVRRQIALALADVLANDNPRFDRTRFLDACEVEL